jgi:hypothetical protein
VIARQHDRAGDQFRMARQRVEEDGPFAGATGIGHIAADDNVVERIGGMDGGEMRQDALEPAIAARARPSAFNAEAVLFGDHVKVGQMRHAPAPRVGRGGIERGEVDGLGHAGIGKSPHQRCSRQISRHQ